MVIYKRGTGESQEDAVIILGAANHQEGIKAEYDFVAQQLGVPGQLWNPASQRLIQDRDKYYDELVVQLRDGSHRSFYFDITDFLPTEIENNLQPSFLSRLLNRLKHLLGMS